MQKKKLSITDVAQALGVSVTTVSLVLNGKGEGRIGASTIRRIKAYAAKVGYKPQPVGRRHHNRVTVGVLLDDITDPQQALLVSEMDKLWRGRGGYSVVVNMGGDAAVGEELLALLQEKRVDGYVVMPFDHMERAIKRLQKDRVPVVLYDGHLEGTDVYHVAVDYTSQLTKAIQNHLAVHKSSRVGLLVCTSDTYRARTFLKGYMDAMDRHSGDVLVKKIQAPLEDTAVKSQISNFVRDNRLDVVVFATDQLARMGAAIIAEASLPVQHVISTYMPSLSTGAAPTYTPLVAEASLVAKQIVGGLLEQLGKKL